MAVYWTYHYIALPVISEECAMDEGSRPPLHANIPTQVPSNSNTTTFWESSTTDQSSRPDQSDMEFAPAPTHHFGQYASPFDMRHVSDALPNYGQQRYVQPQHVYQIAANGPNVAYASSPNQQFTPYASKPFLRLDQQSIPSHNTAFSNYGAGISSNPDIQVHNQYYPPHQQLPYGLPIAQHPQYPSYQSHQGVGYSQMSSAGAPARMGSSYPVPRLQVDSQNLRHTYGSNSQEILRRNSSNSSLQGSSTLRGPPRKPKQSGHALWVGNLPPGTQIVDLKDHFALDATDDIESVFLISKSNCAFVNYKSDEACAAAMGRFHDSRFQGVRLVCRLRRGSAASQASATVTQIDGQIPSSQAPGKDTTAQAEDNAESSTSTSSAKIAKEKFFVVKSLTVEDLERSVQSGIWATQAHNEENLNLAYKTAENVYLIFSANKSGEYFGYARMNSAISAETVQSVKEEPPAVTVSSPRAADAPMTIPTPATATAPRGHVIDDSARGTIFWEAESGNLTPSSAVDGLVDSGETSAEETSPQGSSIQQTIFGKPFQITWQSTEKLPFYRTRGLRNPWNANREVKIARDGTELEPTVGRKLIGMFEQQAPINAAPRAAGPHPQFVYPQQMSQYSSMMPQGSYGYGPQGPSPPYGRPY